MIVPDCEAAAHGRELFRGYLDGQSLYSLGVLGVERGWFSSEGTAKDSSPRRTSSGCGAG